MQELTQDNVQDLRQQLLQMQKDLEHQLNISEAAAGIVVLDQTAVGRISRMDAMQHQSMARSTREKATLRLKKVKLALQDINNDEYGYCKKCDECITLPRLLAQPEANFCLSCQDQLDRQQQ